MMEWHRFKDLTGRLESMYERLTSQLERIIAILDDMRGFVKNTAYWYEEEGENDDGGRKDNN
jgi:hypothetical protein